MRCFWFGRIITDSQVTEIESGKRLIIHPEVIQIPHHHVDEILWNNPFRHTIPVGDPARQQFVILIAQAPGPAMILKLFQCVGSIKPGDLSRVAGPMPDVSRREKLSRTFSKRRGNYTPDKRRDGHGS